VSRSDDGIVKLKDNCGFIMGGDSVDKGNGDIRVLRDLLQLKRTYPDRVFFIIGNRDANKLRFTAELADEDSLYSPPFKRPDWCPTEPEVSFKDYLEQNSLQDTKINRVKWMLAETMGSRTTFRLRKEELEILQEPSDDSSVVNSFLSSVLPSGENNFMYEYLRVAQLIFRVGNTLFVHGGINDENFGTVPGDDIIRENVDDWIRDLNQWAAGELDDYVKQPTWEEYPGPGNTTGKRGGQNLIEYGLPGGNNGKTIIYSYHLPNGNAVDLSEKTENYLVSNGIHRVIVGHQPHGDCPTVISSGRVQVVTGDTSYSQVPAKGDDNRGPAVSEIMLFEESQKVRVHGNLLDERKIDYELACPHVKSSESSCDDLIGKQLKDNFWVKSKLRDLPEDGKEYLVCRGSGFSLTFLWMSASEVNDNLMVKPEETKQ